MRHHVYIEDNTPAWVSISDKVQFPLPSFGWRDVKGVSVLSPPASLQVSNVDAWWLTEPVASGGDFEGS